MAQFLPIDSYHGSNYSDLTSNTKIGLRGEKLKRYIFLFSIGAVLCIGAQLTLSVQVHSENDNALIDALPAIICLMIGGAMIVSGLLGLAENYQSLWTDIPKMVETKHRETLGELSLPGLIEAHQKTNEFWKAYRRICFTICLTLAGILAISTQMLDTPFLNYLIFLTGVSTSIILFGLWFGVGALGKIRASHVAISSFTHDLQSLPKASEIRHKKKISNNRGYVMWTNRKESANIRTTPTKRSNRQEGAPLRT